MTAALTPQPDRMVYHDLLGRPWPVDRLDALLADPEVVETVLFGVSVGLRPDRQWNLQDVLWWARTRYPRESVAVFAALLVTRYFHTAGAHLLGRRSIR